MSTVNENNDKRESGEPGGGAGRKDEVGASGVYPMSGPHPPGPAEIKEQASWGQGERGAAGYEDHGGSELTLEGGQLLGGLDTGAGSEPQDQPPEVGDVEVAHSQWAEFFDSFSRQHMDWLVAVESISPAGKLIAVEELPLLAVGVDTSDAQERVYVQVGTGLEEHITRTIDEPAKVIFKRSQGGAHQGLEIVSADGTTTVVHFRSAMRPETLGDVAA